jgi:hypothetical protein
MFARAPNPRRRAVLSFDRRHRQRDAAGCLRRPRSERRRLIPFLDNALDVIAAPAAAVAGTVLMASSVVEMSPFLKWTLAIVAGGGIAGTVQLFTSATRLASTATTAGLANPAVSVAETGGSAGLSVVAIAAPVVALVLVVVLVYLAVRALVGPPRRAVSRRARRTQRSS